MHLTAPATGLPTPTAHPRHRRHGRRVLHPRLLGLLVLNLFLGPIAIVLAVVALWRGTTRRGRAYLGLTLGIADLVVLVTAMEISGTVSWSL